jgi:hypothetical protein
MVRELVKERMIPVVLLLSVAERSGNQTSNRYRSYTDADVAWVRDKAGAYISKSKARLGRGDWNYFGDN